MLSATLAAVALALSGPDAVPSATERPALAELEREITVEIAGPATARYLPADLGIEVDTALDKADAEAVADALPDPLVVSLIAIEGGTRIRAIHPTRRVDARVTRNKSGTTLVLGAESQAARLRRLGAVLARPMPRPRNIAADLELWQEAEAATAAGELERARVLWEKLELAGGVDDLAALRVAQLFTVSGHINEARARLKAVSRRYPRSTGATLARLELHHLDAISDGEPPSTDQLLLLADSGNRRGFRDYARLRAALVLEEVGRPMAALDLLGPTPDLPKGWQEPAAWARARMLSAAVAGPALHGDALGTALAFAALQADLADHPRRLAILRAVADAHADLGTHDETRVLLRELLRSDPSPADEAHVIVQLADAYRDAADRTRAQEVVTFALRQHPKAPGLLERVRSLALLVLDSDGLPAARELLAALQDATGDAALSRDVLATEADLVLAYGDAPAVVQVLATLRERGWDNEVAREPQLALALARAGRATEAAPLLRKWIGRTTDPEARDRLAYRLAQAELALGHEADATKILELIARSGTVFGRIARLQLRERSVSAVLDPPSQGVTP